MKKIISILCCMAMLLLCLPSAYAETTSDTTKYTLNQAAVDAGTITMSSNKSYVLNANYIQVNQSGYLNYKLTVPNAGTYLMDIYYCTKYDGITAKISVNGNAVIPSVEIPNSNSYSANATASLGKIDLKAGENTIQIYVFDKLSTKVDWLNMKYFTLTKVGDIFYYPMTVDTFSVEGASYNNGVTPAGFVASQNAMDMRDTNGGTNPSWAQAPIVVTKSGWYGISTNIGTWADMECRMDAMVLDTDGNVTSRVSSSIPHTGGMTTYANNYMGMIYLTEGTHTIKFMCTNGVAYVKSFTIGQVQDDLSESTLDFLIRKDTVEIDNFISGGAGIDQIAVQLSKKNSFKFYIYTEKALSYDLSLKCGTCVNGQNINVSVNGYPQITNGTVNATSTSNNYTPTGKQTIGSIYLNRGFNEIEFTRGTTASDTVFIERVYFDLADSFKNGFLTVYTQENRIPQYSGTSFTTAADENCISVAAGTVLTYDVYTTETQTNDVLADALGGSNFIISAAVNGTTQFTSESISVSGNSSAYNTSDVLGSVTVPEGNSTITFTIESGSGYLRSLLLEPSNFAQTQLLSFELQNADGVRVPYSVSEGIEIYAAATIKKVGEAADTVILMLAEYDTDGRLVNTKTEPIDVSDMASRETKLFRTKLTLSGNGGSVKAFVVNEDGFAPMSEEIPSYEDAMIFTPDAIAELKNTNVSYVKATTLETNTAGTYYQDTGIYNDDYTITPIFYEAYNGAKIFAYLGVPASASAENPVPAMVCVHGGNGQAYRTWVEHWAKRGFAAISMDLYGCAPEGSYGWTYNEDQSYRRTPYVGNMITSPWNASAYSQNGDFRQGAMYQNVANVMFAHNILRATPGIDTSKIGITGVSWGGVTTTTTIGVDDRFAFAAPIYGCGYLDIGKGGFETFYSYSNGTINWDPINFAAKADIPILYLNGNNDANFSALSSSYSVGVAKEGYLSIYNNLAHSQAKAESLEQVYRFAENMVAGTNPYIKINSAVVENNILTINCTLPDGTSIENVKMYYITDEEYPDITSYSSVNWQTVSEYTNANGIVTMNVPSGATYLYAELTDQNGDILCTKILY